MSTHPDMTNTALDREEIARLLRLEGPEMASLMERAHAVRVAQVGRKVFFRGIVEISNICTKDCHYCGIRRGNHGVQRFSMKREEIVEAARFAIERRYGSVVLQSGERSDPAFVDLVEGTVRDLKEASGGALGITLSLGEQSEETYRRWFEAGAHRYLLRIETSTPELYRQIHPADHSYEERVACLDRLRAIGYQVGTGVMIGFPGQTVEHLADDVMFFRKMDVDMIGMGPYAVHGDTPMGEAAPDLPEDRQRRLNLALKMIAVCRLTMPDINIASTTALQALHPLGREMGLKAGANVIMPIVTPIAYRKDYQLYDGKPCLDDTPSHCQGCLERRIRSVGDEVGYNEWGDSPHARRRDGSPSG